VASGALSLNAWVFIVARGFDRYSAGFKEQGGSLYKVIIRKLIYELDSALAMARLPAHRKRLTGLLSQSMPSLNVETTNICNANCTFCAYQYQERSTGIMDPALFRKIIDEYAECGGGWLGLTPTVGDPLVDKHLLERIRYARSKPEIGEIFMYSNLISLDLHGVDELLHSGISSLSVSTSGMNPEMYERVYRSRQYKTMLANVKKFAHANNAAGRPVYFSLDMRVDRPISEVEAFPEHDAIVKLVDSQNVTIKFRYDDWSGRIKPNQLSGNMRLRRNWKPRLSACQLMFAGPIVYWDGKVGACSCRDLNASELIVGNVQNQHLGEIWFGQQIKQLRDEFTTDKVRDICKTCSHYSSLSHLLTRPGKAGLDKVRRSPYLDAPHAPSPSSSMSPRKHELSILTLPTDL
jgi:radical SAM protein with 4Fe4S-binding SPASM domain